MNNQVSIIMPLYNCEYFVARSIESVVSQTYKNWELIIVDDQSEDDSHSIVKELTENEPRIQLHQLKYNGGAGAARNYAIELAQGKYIAFLDSDDLWSSEKLEKQIGLMEKENILLSYSSYYRIDDQGRITGVFKSKEIVTYNDMLKTSCIGTLTTVYNAEKLGKYYFEKIGHEDYVMKLQMLKKIKFAKGIVEPLAKYRIVNNSLSRNKFKTAYWQWKIYREVENMSIMKSLYYFVHYAYSGFKKYKKI